MGTVQNKQEIRDRPSQHHSILNQAGRPAQSQAALIFIKLCSNGVRESCALIPIMIDVLLTQGGLTERESEGGLDNNLRKCSSDCWAVIYTVHSSTGTDME